MPELTVIDFPYIQTFFSALAAFLLGMFWYNPGMLGTRWMESRGMAGQAARLHTRKMVYMMTLWLFSAAFYSFMVVLLDVATVPSYISLSCLLWVAFVMPPTIMGVLYTGSSFETATIDTAYQLSCYYLFAVVHILFGMLV